MKPLEWWKGDHPPFPPSSFSPRERVALTLYVRRRGRGTHVVPQPPATDGEKGGERTRHRSGSCLQ